MRTSTHHNSSAVKAGLARTFMCALVMIAAGHTAVATAADFQTALGTRVAHPGGDVDTGVSLRNADAVVRAKLRLTTGGKWRGFVYADMGATDSALRWQGLAGLRNEHGLDLLGGWRRVTYRFSPGMGFDSLDFNGPFLGAAFAW